MPINKLFLSVGAMKSGTTFLYNILSRHPDIFFSPEKELHYFAHTQRLSRALQKPIKPKLLNAAHVISPQQVLSDDFRRLRLSTVMARRYARMTDADALRRVLSWYVDRYMLNPVDSAWLEHVFEGADDRWCADFSNYHAQLSDRGWAGVRDHCRELRVMYVMREPVSRTWSHLKFEMIPTGRRDSLAAGDMSLVDAYLESASSAHARYGDVIQSLRRNLAAEELLILRLEDLIENPRRDLARILDFLGVADFDFGGVDVSAKANQTENLDMPAAVREALTEALRSEIEVYDAYKAADPVG